MITATKTGKDIKPLRMPNSVLLTGMLLGFLADRLWAANGPLGPGFAIWIGLCGLAAFWTAKRTRAADRSELGLWCLASFIAALLLSFRTSVPVIMAMLGVMLATATMVIMQKNGQSLRDIDISDQFVALGRLPKQCLLATFSVLCKIEVGASLLDPRLRAAARGFVLALPVLVIFSLLFASADAVFDQYLQNAMQLFSTDTIDHLLIMLVFGWVATGLLAGVSEKHFLVNRQKRQFFDLGTEDTATILGLILLLFMVFVSLQISYLFGGQDTIEATAGLTLADYARRGFFELLAIAGLTLALLTTVAQTNCNRRVFRPLAGLMIACVLIMLLSAGQRMLLYVDAFGLSLDRLTAVWAMAWIALGLLIFAYTLLRDRKRDFAAGLTLSAIAIAILFALSNPAAMVAKINIDRTLTDGAELDVMYLLTLGSDAAPILIQQIEALPGSARCQIAGHAMTRWQGNNSRSNVQLDDWRWHNASTAAAVQHTQKALPLLTAIDNSCLNNRRQFFTQ